MERDIPPHRSRVGDTQQSAHKSECPHRRPATLRRDQEASTCGGCRPGTAIVEHRRVVNELVEQRNKERPTRRASGMQTESGPNHRTARVTTGWLALRGPSCAWVGGLTHALTRYSSSNRAVDVPGISTHMRTHTGRGCREPPVRVATSTRHGAEGIAGAMFRGFGYGGTGLESLRGRCI